jgi:hypothetical protein
MLKVTKSQRVGFLRLENTNPPHNKFYEMTISIYLDRPYNVSCDVTIQYGRIGTQGKKVPLKGRPLGLPARGADKVDPDTGKRAFLKQLKKKFRDKAYNLKDLKVNDRWLKEEILTLKDEFEGGGELFDRIAEMLEDRGF